ncbi:MAG: hypothetical protein K9N07_11755 [Candidatus Cloacimonetes bacterium]|nr:hypothetical protein [Candidatus Cloacimonadota bacterium]
MKDDIKFQVPDNDNTQRVLKKHFKVTGVFAFEDIPDNKPACLLITKDDRFRCRIMRLALKNDFVVLYNPETIQIEHCHKLFAFIMDEEHKQAFPYPELLENKFIDIEFGIDVIEDLLPKLKSNYFGSAQNISE